MKVHVNGEEREFPAPQSVETLVVLLGIDPGKVAVELNLEIVSKSQYAQTAVAEGDRLEIVHFIGGGVR